VHIFDEAIDEAIGSWNLWCCGLVTACVSPLSVPACQVSNAFGSNIFDMLLGLGFPWFLQMSVVDQGATLYVGQPEIATGGLVISRGLDELSSSLKMLLITMLAWAVGCGCFFRWQIFPTMGYFMCTIFLVWAARQVLGDYIPLFA
jgi:Ca2+/Na+ antiporter